MTARVSEDWRLASAEVVGGLLEAERQRWIGRPALGRPAGLRPARAGAAVGPGRGPGGLRRGRPSAGLHALLPPEPPAADWRPGGGVRRGDAAAARRRAAHARSRARQRGAVLRVPGLGGARRGADAAALRRHALQLPAAGAGPGHRRRAVDRAGRHRLAPAGVDRRRRRRHRAAVRAVVCRLRGRQGVRAARHARGVGPVRRPDHQDAGLRPVPAGGQRLGAAPRRRSAARPGADDHAAARHRPHRPARGRSRPIGGAAWRGRWSRRPAGAPAPPAAGGSRCSSRTTTPPRAISTPRSASSPWRTSSTRRARPRIACAASARDERTRRSPSRPERSR